MLNEILNLEGVAVLSKEQQKSVNGGGYYTNFQCTGKTYSGTIGAPNGDTVQGMECTASYQNTFLGISWGSAKPKEVQVFLCPKCMCESHLTSNWWE